MQENNDFEQILERIGQLVDKSDNLIAATKLPLPAQMHLMGLLNGITEIREEVLSLYKDLGGEDVWQDGDHNF